MVFHFFKWLELVPLSYHNNEVATYAFMDIMLIKFGALAKVLIDQSTKFCKNFLDSCEKALIDHRTTSWDHPKANKLAEQMVQIVKWKLWKNGL